MDAEVGSGHAVDQAEAALLEQVEVAAVEEASSPLGSWELYPVVAVEAEAVHQ